MKRGFAIICLLTGAILFSQSLLIPQKKGDLFGLTDESGNWVFQPEFTSVEWLIDEYLQVSKTVETDDTIKISDTQNLHRTNPIRLKGLIYKGKELIEPGPYVGFHIIPETIISAKVYGKPENVSLNQNQYDEFKGKDPLVFLFDRNGKNVNPEGYGRLEFVGDAGKSSINPGNPRYILLFVEDFVQKHGMFVFDADKGEIKEWLFKDVWGFNILDGNKAMRKYYVSYIDSENKAQNKMISMTDDYFELADSGDQLPEKKPMDEMIKEYNRDGIVLVNDDSADSGAKLKKPIRYFMKEENLYYEAEKGKSEAMNLPEDFEVIFLNQRRKDQTQNLIYKKDNRYGLIKELKPSSVTYDSLIYFGSNNYMNCNKIDNRFKCGTLDSEGNPVIPMEYDSILGKPKEYEFIKDPKTNQFTLKLKEIDSKISSSRRGYTHHIDALPILVVFKNGKAGMVSMENEKILPVKYDELGMNKVKTTWGGKSDHLVTREGNLFGMVMNNYNRETKEVHQEIIEPIFENYPGFIYRDYLGRKGFNLIGLFDENGNFVSYASDVGKLYVEQ